MTVQVKDRVKETTTTSGTGAITLAGAMAGFRAFSSVCSVGDTFYYALQAVDANGNPTGAWEVGLGTYSATNTLTRTTVLDSSAAGAAISLSGTTQVWLDLPAALAKPLAPDARVAVYATNTSAQSIPSATWTQITGWTSVKDTSGGAWNASTGTFTAPVAGWYSVTTNIAFANNAWTPPQEGGLSLYLAGTQQFVTLFTMTASATINLSPGALSVDIYLNAGDTIVAKAYQGTSGALALYNVAVFNYFTVAQI